MRKKGWPVAAVRFIEKISEEAQALHKKCNELTTRLELTERRWLADRQALAVSQQRLEVERETSARWKHRAEANKREVVAKDPQPDVAAIQRLDVEAPPF